MDGEIVLRLLVYGLLLALSGFFSGSEMSLFSLSPVQLLRLEQESHPRIGAVKRLLAQPRRLIVTLFIGNEVVNIAASALMTSLISRALPQHGSLVTVLTTTAISVFLILMFGEMVPKTVAVSLKERWATRVARPIEIIALLMTPLRWSFERIADGVLYLVGRGRMEPAEPQVSEREFLTMVDQVRRLGLLGASEESLIRRVFELSDRVVSDVMTPVDKLFALSDALSAREMTDAIRKQHYSRIPVYQGSEVDRVVGILHAKDLVSPDRFEDRADKEDVKLPRLHAPFFVPRNVKCDRLLRDLRRRRTHIALVVNEAGRMVGLVTLEDLLEEMFGEIVDEKEVRP